jgi:hypothetical protein
VFNLPEKPNCCKAARISVLSSKAHHVRDAHQLASPVPFFHLPLTHVPTSTTYLEPVSKMGRQGIEIEIEPITRKEWETARGQALS